MEAESREGLRAGMQGLKVRLARGSNRAIKAKGTVFAHRYQATALASPQAVWTALVQVLNQASDARGVAHGLGRVLAEAHRARRSHLASRLHHEMRRLRRSRSASC